MAIVNSAATTVGVHVSFQITVLSGICTEVGLLDHMATLFFAFWGTSILFSIVAAPTYIPTRDVGGFPFLLSLHYLLFVDFVTMAILTSVT